MLAVLSKINIQYKIGFGPNRSVMLIAYLSFRETIVRLNTKRLL